MNNISLSLTLGIIVLSLFISKQGFSQNNWDGDNGAGNFSYNDNWYSNTFPIYWNSTTDLLFQVRNNLAQTSLYYDLGWLDIRSIIFQTTYPQYTPINGNGNGLNFWYKVENNSSYSQDINIPLSVKGIAAELNAVNGDLYIRQPIFNDANKVFSSYSYNNKSVVLQNYLVGNNSVNYTMQNSGYGYLKIDANLPGLSSSSFSGGINVNRGELWFNAGSAINGGTLRIGNGDANVCKLYINDIDGGTTVSNAINVPTSSTNSYIGGLNTSGTNIFSGAITLNAVPTFENYGGGTLEIQGDISGSSVAVNIGRVSGTGNSVIKYSTNAKTYTGLTTVNGNATLQLSLANVLPSTNNITVASTGLLKISANQTINNLDLSAGGNLTVDAGCTLTINGTYSAGAGTITNNGKIVLVGPTSFPGASSTIGAMNDLEINRASGVTLDKAITVAGTLILTSGSLSGSLSYGANGILTYNGTTYTTTSNVEFPSTSGPKDLNITVANASGISLHANRTLEGNLTITASQKFIIPASMQLTVTGTLTNNATETGLVVKSGGSLIQSSAVSATVEREITGWADATHGWHFLSSPVTTQAISPGFTSATATDYDFYAWWAPTNVWVNYKNTSVAPTWATANVLGITSGGDNFIPGKGYLVSYATDAAGTKQFKGILNIDNIDISNLPFGAGTNQGFYLLGNPFTSAITWGTGWSLTNINATAKVWKESTAAYVDRSSGEVIPSLNGFLVEINTGFGGNNSLTIPAIAKVHNGTAWYKSAENPKIVLVANDPSGQTAQESQIRVFQEATGGFDTEFDSHFYPGFAPKFYSTVGSDQLSTNTLPNLPAESMIPFGFVKNDATNFSIELKESMEGYEVYLKDLKTNTDQNLTENPVYTFTSETNDDANRFVLHFLSTTGTTEPSCPAALRIYSNAGNIYLSGATGKAEVYVRNMLGQTVMQRSVSGDALKVINAENLTSGVYIVSVVNSGQTLSGKVIIK